MITSILTIWISWILAGLAIGNTTTYSTHVEWIEGINAIDDFTPNELVNDIFVKGACKNIFNISSSGRPESIGYFEQGEDVIGLKEGIILATGPIEHAEGPNNNGRRSGRFGLKVNDPDLQKLANSDTIMDAAVLEFDFIPLDSNVTFRYVFASEEYCEYVDNVFNDVFGFFVSGPGIDGRFSDRAINVALIPETNDFVTINSVNHLRNSNYYINNVLREDADECGIPFNPPPAEKTIQFDGFTKVLTATLDLIPCETYHLRLVVADVGDDSWDSAVFLEAESFNIGGKLELNAATNVGKDTIPEGCDYGYFRVSRIPGEPMDVDVSIGLRVGDASSAEEGIDFMPLPDSVTIPAGELGVDIPVQLIIDDEVERVPESIILEFDFPCACISDTARLYVQDPISMLSGVYDQDICVGDTAELATSASGGVPGYTYSWSNGSTDPNIQRKVDVDETVTVTITDACGRQLVQDVQLNTKPVPEARIPNLVRTTCIDDTIRIPITFQGSPPFHFSYLLDDTLGGKLEEIYQNPYLLTIAKEGEVRLVDFGDAECSGITTGRTDLRFYRIQTLATSLAASCNGAQDGSIRTEVVGGTEPYQYDWGPGVDPIANPSNLFAGEYTCLITDANNCRTSLSVNVNEPNPLRPITFECREFEADRLRISGDGGTPPYLYAVDGSSFKDEALFDQLIGGNTYQLQIQDAEGCLLDQSFIMPVLRENIIELSGAVKLELGERYIIQPQLNVPESLIDKITWIPDKNLSCNDCLNPELIALEDITYRIRIDDVFGCVDAGAISIKLDKKPSIFIPSAFSPDGNDINERLVVFANPDQVQEIAQIKIFNRWGQLVFSDQNFAPNLEGRGWDGTHNGRNLDAGTYIYTTTFVLTNGTQLQQNGTVHLIK